MMGFLQRGSIGLLAAICVLFLASELRADKVGVAAAVNPDAFSSLAGSPQSQLNIGKSIFYNERINTTDSGLVQVLLVDGSTFTVGPGSDLVIDKFVYDPKKGVGQISASFSKGVMRFVGGKISKKEGGVTVDTPAGALAIRGGIALVNFNGPKEFSILFVFGHSVQLEGQAAVFEPGYGYFSNNGLLTTRPFDASDVKIMLASLTNNSGGFGNKPPDAPKPSTLATLFSTQSLSQLISDANTSQIVAEAQILPPPPSQSQITTPEAEPTTTYHGYAGGIYTQETVYEEETTDYSYERPVGTLTSSNPNDVAVSFDNQTQAFAGAKMTLFADEGGGAEFAFTPVSLPTDPPTNGPNGPQTNLSYEGDAYEGEYSYENLFAGLAEGDAVKIYHETDHETDPPRLQSQANLIAGQAGIVGIEGASEVLCEDCEFLKWGVWVADAEFHNESNTGQTSVTALGFWVAGELTDVDALAALGGEATYSGHVLGSVASYNCETGWDTYVATGDLEMNWNFGSRSGDLTISNFDGRDYSTNPYGEHPGALTQPSRDFNQFGGSLHQTGGASIGEMNGRATGSFVNNGRDQPAAGVVGNWSVGSNSYQASGVFAGRKN